LAAVTLTVIGAFKRWLSAYEWVSAVALLVIPYLTRAQEMNMTSMGRFASVVLANYLVLGHLLCRLPGPVVTGLLALSGFLLGAYAALFASGHMFI
jgi:hypothetical protein